MLKTFLLLLCLALLTACSGHLPWQQTDTGESGYFADAAKCYESTMHKEQIKLNVGGNSYPSPSIVTPIVIDLPSVYDADAFQTCIIDLGYAPPKVDPHTYLTETKNCLDQARGTANPNEAYTACIRSGHIEVELIGEKHVK
jgi:hypothetical protein